MPRPSVPPCPRPAWASRCVTAYRKRFLAAARIAAYSLVPDRPGDDRSGRAGLADTAFSPTAWAGFGVLGGAWLLFTTTRAVERRRRRQPQGAQGRRRPRGATAVAPAASAPSLAAGRGTASRPRPAGRKPRGGGAGDDFSDIEAILKKHGI